MWVARFAGIDIEGVADTEVAAKRELVAAFTKWVTFEPNAKAELQAFLEAGGSEDVTVRRLDPQADERERMSLGRDALALPPATDD